MLATQKGRSKPVLISSRRWLKLIFPPDGRPAEALGIDKAHLNVETLKGQALRFLVSVACKGVSPSVSPFVYHACGETYKCFEFQPTEAGNLELEVSNTLRK
jgi:hypothetical protein